MIYRFNSILIIIQYFLTFLVAAVGYSETADTERPKYYFRPYDNDTVATDLNLETGQSGSFRDNGPR